tara:strand:- start:52 stop:1401 length:1350 start_codon:yes stop_codon:yes gene_type:complete
MATITDKKYGEGHEVQLKPSSPNQKVKDLFKGYVFGKSTFKKTLIKYKSEDLDKFINLENGDDSVCLIDEKGKKIFVKGKTKAISAIFNHAGAGGKADTELNTAVKENMSMILFRASKIPTEEEAVAQLKDMMGDEGLRVYTTKDYDSAVNQLGAFKKFFGTNNGYEFERQADGFTAPLYKLGTKLSGKAPDNWNPADVWAKKKNFKLDKLLAIENIDRLNQEMVTAFNNKDLVGISLKQTGKPTSAATREVVDPQKLFGEKVPLDFTFTRLSSFTEFFRNSYIETKSGFQVRVGHKQAGLVAPFMEGKLAGAGYQIGGIDAKEHKNRIKDKYGYILRNSANIPSDGPALALKEAKDLLNSTKKIFTGNDAVIVKKFINFGGAPEKSRLMQPAENNEDKEIKGRFVNLISFLYAILIKTGKDYDNHMSFCYNLARKVSSLSCIHLLIKG